uniref:Uncharacterized protein n=1 Tax=Lotharella oceanica TaxID=641309 RepID=A0A7S2TTC7_9EUKA|mmetsp:Transcript_27254/g.50888  ORF Transcript_27254/g.50888 Transcript_27254/m.50888 type:complete len:164 (+) Transcript_27254:22-513(+)
MAPRKRALSLIYVALALPTVLAHTRPSLSVAAAKESAKPCLSPHRRMATRRGMASTVIPGSLMASFMALQSRALEINDARGYDWKKFDEVRSDKRAQKGYPNRCGYDYCIDGKIVVPLKDENGNEYWVLKDSEEDRVARGKKKLEELNARSKVSTKPKYKSAY